VTKEWTDERIETPGRYEILNKIGSGSYADVYRARDVVLNQIVALKVLKPALIADAEAMRRLSRRADGRRFV